MLGCALNPSQTDHVLEKLLGRLAQHELQARLTTHLVLEKLLEGLNQRELQARLTTHLVLEKLLEGLDQRELQVLGQSPHVVVGLDCVAVLLATTWGRA